MIGEIASVLTGVIWGATPVLYEDSTERIGPVLANLMKSIGALTVNFVMIAPFGLMIPWGWPLALLILESFIAGGAGDFLFFLSMRELKAFRAVPIIYMYLILANIWNLLLNGGSLPITTVVGMLLAVTGIWIMFWRSGSLSLRGLVYALSSMVLFSIAPVIAQIALRSIQTVQAAFVNSLFLSVMFSLFIPFSKRRISRRGALSGFVGGALGVGLGVFLYFLAIQSIGITFPVLCTALSPLTVQVFSWMSGRSPDLRSICGAAVVVSGLMVSLL